MNDHTVKLAGRRIASSRARINEDLELIIDELLRAPIGARNINRAADLAGVTRRTLYKRLEKRANATRKDTHQ